MIVKMSKIEVIGPRALLMHALGTIRRAARFQVDPTIQPRLSAGAEGQLKPVALDAAGLAEQSVYPELKAKIDRLLNLLPSVPGPALDLGAVAPAASLGYVVDQRLAHVEERSTRRRIVRAEIDELTRHLSFLRTVQTLAPVTASADGLEMIAVEVKDRAAVDRLAAAAETLNAHLHTAPTDDGSYIGLLTTEKDTAGQLKVALHASQIPEAAVPEFLEGMSLPQKIAAVTDRIAARGAEAQTIDDELTSFAQKWRGLYEATRAWLQDRIALLVSSSGAYATANCFVLFGWTPTADLVALKAALATQYGGRVVVDEKEILEQELDDVPVALRNRGYFEPFELLVSWLPLPKYTSFDATPFIAIFFPLMFGMILGDCGYGVVVLAAAFWLIARGRSPVLEQTGKILGVAAVYSVIFGILFGECFGEAGAHALGLPAPVIDRRTSIVPMLYFALATGTVHVLVGLVLGFLTALRTRHTREAAFRIGSVVAMLCLAALAASYLAPIAELFRRPLLVVIGILMPILIVTGGLLAPLELLRDLGNIISYARIMAVGLASVLLAFVANNLAGAAGSIWVGIIVAVFLHAINIVLGVFAPTVHALRLHYVEFFSKFLEPGGKRFAPLNHGQ